MALDRGIALGILGICCIYGYVAFFQMDATLPPFMRRYPVWPSTFPKILAVVGALVALWILVFQQAPAPPKEDEIDYRRLTEYKLTQAVALILLMLAYAFTLRPLGFLLSTVLFLSLGAAVLGERKFHILLPVAMVAAGTTWWLVSDVVGIFMRPLPGF